MKKYIIIFLFLAKQLCASPDSVVVSRCYSYYNGVSTGYSYSVDRYDSAGNFLSNHQIQLSNNPPQNYTYTSERTTRILNQFGNPVSSLYEIWNGSDWDSISTHVYAYDNSQNLIADTSFNLVNNTSSVTEIDWDVNNDTLALKHLYFNNGTYQFGDSTHYLFNANGLIDTYEGYNGTPLIRNYRRSYLYDASNHIINYTWENGTGTGWVNYQQFLYSYDTSNRLTAYSKRSWVTNYWDVLDTSNYTFTASGKIDHSMISQNQGCCTDSVLTFNFYDANDSIIRVDQFKYFFPSNTSDSLRTITTRDPNGHVIDFYEMRATNGVYHNTGLYHHDLSLLPDTDRVFYMICDSVSCGDTLEFIVYSYFPGGQTYYIHHYVGGGTFEGGEISTTMYDSLGRLISSEGNTWGPGNLGHGIGNWQYDANGNLIYYYTLGEGSVGIPTETECYYDFYYGSGSLAVNLMLDVNDTVCDGTPLPGFILITGGTSPYQISWNDSTEIIDASTLTPVIVPVNQSNFVVTITDDTGATATDSVSIKNPYFVLDLGLDTILCQWDTLVLVAPSGFTDYNWMSGTTQSNTIQLFSVSPDTIQVYLDVMDMQGCVYSDSMNTVFEICSAVEETLLNQPVIKTENGSVTLLFPERNCPDRFTINTIDGRKIISSTANGCVIEINTVEFTPGIYLLKYIDRNQREVSLKIPLF